MTTTKTSKRVGAVDRVGSPLTHGLTERQADMMLRAVLGVTPWGSGFGPLAVDLRTYDSLMRRQLLEEVAVERGFGLGPGVIAVATGKGCLEIAAHLDAHPHGEIAAEWLREWRGR